MYLISQNINFKAKNKPNNRYFHIQKPPSGTTKKLTSIYMTVDKNKSRSDNTNIRKNKIQDKKHQVGQRRLIYINKRPTVRVK